MRLGRNGYILLSIGMHLALAALALGFSHFLPHGGEKYYQVSLVELPAAQTAAPVAPVTPVAPEPAPLEEPAKPEPAPEPPPVKRISPVKKTAPAPKPTEKPQPAYRPAERPEPAPTEAGMAGEPGPMRQIGGLSAYEAALVDEPPAITRRALPAYPARARGRVRGRVEISLVVDVSGNPRELRVAKAEPAGYGFEEAALKAARQTRFLPGKVRGKPVNTLVTLPFVFNIR